MNNANLRQDALKKDSLRKDYNKDITGNFAELLAKLRRLQNDFDTSPGSSITATDIANWNSAYSWGNHAGIYLPLLGGTMANTNLVTNLNADLLDGKHLSAIMTDVNDAIVLAGGFTAYDYDITGARNGINLIYTLPFNYKSGSLKVYVNGLRLQKKTLWDSYDYEESGANTITLTNPMNSTDMILIDYLKQ